MTEAKELFLIYWPHILFVLSGLLSAVAAVHAAMTKQDVRAAIGWVGVVLFSPFLGPFLYAVAGINRIRKERVSQLRSSNMYPEEVIDRVLAHDVVDVSGPQFAALRQLGDRVTDFRLLGFNRIKLLNGGDETYPAMLEAIESAQKSIALQSYIFDHDPIGEKIAGALIDAVKRGVQVRVLIDAVGSKYSHPPIVRMLEKGGVRTALFMRPVIGLRLVYANLRSHRKLLVIDGMHGFTGGMNIRAGFMTAIAKEHVTHDTHFQVGGPIIHQLMVNFAHDWHFTTQEKITGDAWFSNVLANELEPGVPIRCVPSGPDSTIGNTHKMLMGALSVAQTHVRIQSPYFLPDQPLIAALATAARRGVIVDIVIPGANNLKLVSAAMSAQFDQLLQTGCRIWRSSGTFDHSKLFTVDGSWSYVGSSNLDPRSLRLNFELDIEVYDRQLAQQLDARIDAAISTSTLVTLDAERRQPFLIRLRNRVVWLASPYL
ncbi:cardiolipin synthase [Orrella sp. NBD-18]|uniref:Cardiolipin synthase n=1 Tax=Sheuella amnicola TaxID=2707330 RepID=A0A6B2R158_9BURK|nr:phospholipase D-like domain-containing protein [Sheuella amnicola]NDY83863.1 cardiolipin synthase [Sheuella amnicola]HBI83874.1 cardiolipin synthase [Alcaligenaceae bacterium]